MKRTIVIFSNPFGYGPTGKAVAIAKELLARAYHSDVIFAGGSFVREIIPHEIRCADIDERNEAEIIELLKGLENPLVVSSQNRFPIYAGKRMGLRTAFLDGLAWFWKEIPEDHFLADEIFWMKYPGIEKKIPRGIKNIHVVSAVIDVESKNADRSQTLIHLGGCKNPLTDIFPKTYLDLLITPLSTNASKYEIKILGGENVVSYLRKLAPNLKAESVEHDQFIKELDRSAHFITTAGQTAVLEAFALGVPTSFLLPMNLSQMALTDFLENFEASKEQLKWSDYVDETEPLFQLSEKEAIVKYTEYAAFISRYAIKKKNNQADMLNILATVPGNEEQKRFIKYVGIDGAKQVVDILADRWNL